MRIKHFDVQLLAGDFNGWVANATAMTDMGGNVWSATVTSLTPML